MGCPECNSTFLDIRQPTGFIEPILIILTGKRKFRCRNCLLDFRAPDPKAASQAKANDAKSSDRELT
jgi:hypothetical protein